MSVAEKPAQKTICFVIPAHWQAFMGGAQYQAKFLLEYLVERGHKVYYIARRTQGANPSDHTVLKLNGIKYSRVFDSLHLLRLLRHIGPDVIYQRVGCAYTGVCAFYANRMNSRMIWHVASDMDVSPLDEMPRNPLHAVEKKILEFGLRRASQIVTQTNDQFKALQKNYNRQADAVIRNFHPPATESIEKPPRFTALWIGNLKAVKQPQVMVEIARDLQHKIDAQFVMIGKPFEQDHLQQAFEASIQGLSNVRYIPGTSNEEVNRLLAQSHLLINTSSVEGFSNTFIQAWMRQVPVISLNVNPDNVFDDELLGIAAGGDYKMMLESICRLVQDSSLYAKMSEQCAHIAHEQYSHNNLYQLANLIEMPQTGLKLAY